MTTGKSSILAIFTAVRRGPFVTDGCTYARSALRITTALTSHQRRRNPARSERHCAQLPGWCALGLGSARRHLTRIALAGQPGHPGRSCAVRVRHSEEQLSTRTVIALKAFRRGVEPLFHDVQL